MRRDTPFFPRTATRWWQAPQRLRAATLALLRRAVPPREQPNECESWLRQPKAGIRA